jgi:hypothetical protein
LGWFVAIMAALAAVAAPFGYWFSGVVGLACVATANGVCVGVGVLALVIQARITAPHLAFAHVLVGFSLRMGIPLAVCMVVYLRKSALADAGFVFYLLVFYMAALAAGTGVMLPSLASRQVKRD